MLFLPGVVTRFISEFCLNDSFGSEENKEKETPTVIWSA